MKRIVHTATPRIFVLGFCAMLLIASCGKKRNIAPEEIGTPNTMPYEQILFREARATLTAWLKVFSGETPVGVAYDMLTQRSRQRLKDLGVASKKDFETWFQTNRHDARPPFYYRFSRVDILDTDIRDTMRSIVTATMLVDVQSQKIESIGSFILVREHGSWKIPFAESGEWLRSWWEQERAFGSRLKDDGFTDHVSAPLSLEILYPVSWDVSESGAFKVPNEAQAQHGIELSYLNPSTLHKEAIIRIWTKPHESAAITDSVQTGLVFIEKYEATITDATSTAGRIYVYDDPRNSRHVYLYAGVNTAETTFANYSSAITKILESLSIVE